MQYEPRTIVIKNLDNDGYVWNTSFTFVTCDICYALVEQDKMESHLEWHKTILDMMGVIDCTKDMLGDFRPDGSEQ
jgi:hypothetical protein